MILIDFSNLATSNYIVYAGEANKSGEQLELDFFRHAVLNSIRKVIKKFGSKYGSGGVFLCIDSPSWRKYVFEHYKARRNERKKTDDYDWKWYKNACNTLLEEFRENVNVKVLRSRGAEADDIIGTMVHKFHAEHPIMIVSRDRDFCPLQQYPSVKQYDMVKESLMQIENPQFYLFEKIVRGDPGDDIPNALSPADIFITKAAKQKSVFAKDVEKWFETGIPDEHKERFELNKKLIDLSQTPDAIKDEIVQKYHEETEKPLPNLNTIRLYCIAHNLSSIKEQINDFQY